MNKRVTLLLIAIFAVLSLLAVIPAPALAYIPKTSVPEFTLKLVSNSYDVPPFYAIDQYTGENVTTQSGYHVENKSIEVAIKNPPFVSLFNGTKFYLYYKVRSKGHFGADWNELHPYSSAQSNSKYTVMSFPADYPVGAKLDFQVEALVGYDSQVKVYGRWWCPNLDDWHYEPVIDFFDETSGWSDTQTIAIPNSVSSPPSSSSSSNQTIESTTDETAQTLQPELIVGSITAIILGSAVLLVNFKKRRPEAGRP